MFGSSIALRTTPGAAGPRSQCGAEQRADDVGQLLGFGYRGVGGATEHPAQLAGVGARADRQAQAADPLPTRLAQRTPRIGGAVDALVSVVVGQSVGQHDEQPPGRPGLLGDDRRAMADRGAEPRIRAWA